MADLTPLPKWIQRRYAVLWSKFGEKQFTHQQAVAALKPLKDDAAIVSLVLSEMKQAGWLQVGLSLEDSRIRNYVLLAPEKAYRKIAAVEVDQ